MIKHNLVKLSPIVAIEVLFVIQVLFALKIGLGEDIDFVFDFLYW